MIPAHPVSLAPAPSITVSTDLPLPAGVLSPTRHVVCLCAQWCGACRDYRPVFEQVARANPNWHFAWVDIEDHADLADPFDVETFPTLLVADQSGTRFVGALLPFAGTLTRMLSEPPVAHPSAGEVTALLRAIEGDAAQFGLS